MVVVEGTTPAALKAGAGHYRGTPLPCEMGNVAIAGHRTTYGKPFNQIDRSDQGRQDHLEDAGRHLRVRGDGSRRIAQSVHCRPDKYCDRREHAGRTKPHTYYMPSEGFRARSVSIIRAHLVTGARTRDVPALSLYRRGGLIAVVLLAVPGAERALAAAPSVTIDSPVADTTQQAAFTISGSTHQDGTEGDDHQRQR